MSEKEELNQMVLNLDQSLGQWALCYRVCQSPVLAGQAGSAAIAAHRRAAEQLLVDYDRCRGLMVSMIVQVLEDQTRGKKA